jgi:hypothetical protein
MYQAVQLSTMVRGTRLRNSMLPLSFDGRNGSSAPCGRVRSPKIDSPESYYRVALMTRYLNIDGIVSTLNPPMQPLRTAFALET